MFQKNNNNKIFCDIIIYNFYFIVISVENSLFETTPPTSSAPLQGGEFYAISGVFSYSPPWRGGKR